MSAPQLKRDSLGRSFMSETNVVAVQTKSPAAQWIARSAILAAFLVVAFVLPWVAMHLPASSPTMVVNLLFFGPQYVYPTAWSGGSAPHHYDYWSLPVWAAAIILFGLASRRWSLSRTVRIAPVVILVVTVCLHLFMSIVGLRFELDGP
jgi:hypothetical protein